MKRVKGRYIHFNEVHLPTFTFNIYHFTFYIQN